MPAPALVWFRSDLRLTDNPALTAAVASGSPVIPLFIWSPEEEGAWAPGAASRWYLHQSLAALEAELRQLGSCLVIRRGPSAASLLHDLVRTSGAASVFLNARAEPHLKALDEPVLTELRSKGVAVRVYQSSLLHEPDLLRTDSREPYQVFTPFFRKFSAVAEVGPPLPAPHSLGACAPSVWPVSDALEDLDLLPRIPWDTGLRTVWVPGERAAMDRLHTFVDERAASYGDDRNRLGLDGTSMLSPALHFGEVSPRQVWHIARGADRGDPAPGNAAFLRQVVWREFSAHVLHHFPHTSDRPLKPAFEAFPWSWGGEGLERWQKGLTGFPIVDAAMRQLWETGWMHNRARMVVASFLTKNLLIHWLEGARWFWDTLVDADLANNTFGWQWSAGCGADPQPFFRIFNPMMQGRKFDSDGSYVRRWIPELARLPNATLHAPWEASRGDLLRAGIELGVDYPRPMVDHHQTRSTALAALEGIR
jgi:deoxyribodipyrimidine photo-lyase